MNLFQTTFHVRDCEVLHFDIKFDLICVRFEIVKFCIMTLS
jgi:hypothetical protein